MLVFMRAKLNIVSKAKSAREKLQEQLWEDHGSELLQAIMDAYYESSTDASKAELIEILERKDAVRLLNLFPWQFKGEKVINTEAVPAIRDVMEQAALSEAKTLGLGFSITRREVADWLRQESALMSRSMTGFQYQTMLTIVNRGINEGLSVEKVANLLRQGEIVWLDPASANAVMNFARRQLEAGVRASIADARTMAYAERLLQNRALMLARTASSRAMTEGLLQVYHQGLMSGELPPSTMVEWVVDGNPCDKCLDLDGRRVRIGEAFPGGYQGPPLHPNCACSLVLVDP